MTHPLSGRDRGFCVGHPDTYPNGHPAKREEFGHSGSRCKVCENARKHVHDLKRRAERQANPPPPKPKAPPVPKQPQRALKVVPRLPFATYEERLVLATFGPASGGIIRRKLRERRIAEWFGGGR